MEQQILKKDIIFTGNGLRIYMFIKHEYDDFDKIVPIVKSVYPVLNHTIKGDCLFVVTQDAFIEWDKFNLSKAYAYCIHAFKRSDQYFETDITEANVIIDKGGFFVLPQGADVFSMIQMNDSDFKENVLNEIENLTNQRDEKLFDRLEQEI